MKKTPPDKVKFIKDNYNKYSNKKELSELLKIPHNTLLKLACKLKVTRQNINKKGDINRTCTVCNTTYPKTNEFFTSFVSTRDDITFQTKCRPCEKIYIQNRKSNPKDTFISILNRIKNSPKRTSKGFDIDCDFALNLLEKQNNKCAITNIELTCKKGEGLQYSNITIDRIDSSKGYTKDNIQILSYWANMAKGALTDEDFKKLITITYNNYCN